MTFVPRVSARSKIAATVPMPTIFAGSCLSPNTSANRAAARSDDIRCSIRFCSRHMRRQTESHFASKMKSAATNATVQAITMGLDLMVEPANVSAPAFAAVTSNAAISRLNHLACSSK